jgi:spore coat protein H
MMKRECESIVSWMSQNLRNSFSILLVSFLPVSNSHCQLIQTDNEKLSLLDSGKKIENTIYLQTSKSGFESITSITGNKINLKTTAVIINGDTLAPERINTRGQTTLNFRRKSYNFNLKSSAKFHHGLKTYSSKKFDVISLSMDKYYINNRLAFEMMEACQLFDLFYSFCELRVNGHSEGIGMVVERPEDWAMKKKNSPLLIRRGYNHHTDKIVTGKTNGKDEVDKYSNYYKQIYASLNKYKGEVLYKTLSNWIDLDIYMKWLAFNFLVRNGDYTDEVFFYIDPVIQKFSIIPWDYDDLFFIAPHEGNAERRKLPAEKLIFSVEDQLDKKIVTDTYLYEIYLIKLKEVLTQLSPPVLKRVFENTFAELYPYYSNNEILSMSAYDVYKDANLEKLKSDMSSLYEFLLSSRLFELNIIETKN